MKIIFVALFLVAAVATEQRAQCTSDSEHTIIIGTCDGQGTLVYNHNLKVDAIWFPIPSASKREITLTFATPIQCIKIFDKVENNNGGCPSIDAGVSFNYVTMHFVSQVAKKMDFDIEIWTKPSSTIVYFE